MELISRKEARSKSLRHYYTGKPCCNGHLCVRKTTSTECIQCAREYQSRHRKTSRGKLQTKKQRRRDAGKARKAIENAVARGKIMRMPCERCGKKDNIHAHHEDYSKPFDVTWLCPTHHWDRHREINMNKRKKSNPKPLATVE